MLREKHGMTTAIIVAAGKSERMGAGTDKAFLSLGNKPVVAWSLLAFERCADVDRIVLVVRKEQQLAAKAVARMFGISKLVAVVPGGNKRQESVQAGLAACDADTRFVVVHDGARPCITPDVVSEVVKLAKRVGAATVGRRMTDTVKRVEKGTAVAGTENREKLWAVQTPQAFQFSVLANAYKALGKNEVTDDCQAVELAGGTVRIYENRAPNFKITTVEDLQIASALLAK
jgi:2-C-methyl-D-erythritol 4-phosphate cytidylyltransferase